jgi:cupin 2 domain-containing protein
MCSQSRDLRKIGCAPPLRGDTEAMKRGNLLAPASLTSGEELFETLIETEGLRLERIVSCHHAGPPRAWLEQERDEWVVVITGSAQLLFEGRVRPISLAAGDWVRIPARVRHRVVRTDVEQDTVWLALHYNA